MSIDLCQAVDYKYNEYGDCYYVESKMETSSEQNPLSNDLFEIVTEVQSDTQVYAFESFDLEYSEDNSKSRVIRKTLGYDGIATTEVLSDFLVHSESEKIMNEHNGWAEYAANGYKNKYDDGLVLTDRNTGKGPYAYNDINGVYYIFSDPDLMGWELSYNLGLIQEYWREQIYVLEQDFPEWGDGDTYIYTIFSDDVNYKFLKAEISNFDDNGYAIMQYEGKQYIIKLKRGFIPTVFYNGEKIKFDQIPVIENGRTLVPLRAIFEKIGAEVGWNGDTHTISAKKEIQQFLLQ